MVVLGRPRRSRGWAVVVIVIFVSGLIGAPVSILLWQVPYFQSTSFAFADVGGQFIVNFESNGPMSAGNPVWVYGIWLQVAHLPWNVSSFWFTILGYNASFQYRITIGPVDVNFCAWTQPCARQNNFYSASVGPGAGELLFFQPGNAVIDADLNMTYEGGWYFEPANVIQNGTSYFPTYSILLGPTDLLFQLLTLKLVAISIFVGGMLAGYFPTVEGLERYLRRIRG